MLCKLDIIHTGHAHNNICLADTVILPEATGVCHLNRHVDWTLYMAVLTETEP